MKRTIGSRCAAGGSDRRTIVATAMHRHWRSPLQLGIRLQKYTPCRQYNFYIGYLLLLNRYDTGKI